MTPVYLLWDWNGTLLDDTDAAIATLNLMLKRRGRGSVAREIYRERFRFPVKPYYKEIGLPVDDVSWNIIATEFAKIYADMPRKLAIDAVSALAFASHRVVGQSIISALRQDLLEREVNNYKIAEFFQYVCGSDNLNGASKMERARWLFSVLAQAPSPRFVLIGDSLHDAEVAADLGIDCVLYAGGSHAPSRLRAVAPVGETLLDCVKLALA